MIQIDQYNNIAMTKGDDVVLDIDLVDDDGEAYTMASGDTLTLTVRETPSANTALLTKTATGTNQITIAHADTSSIAAGRYAFDIELTKASDSTKHTVVGSTPLRFIYFTLIEEVTR